jgi:hypothetical protein
VSRTGSPTNICLSVTRSILLPSLTDRSRDEEHIIRIDSYLQAPAALFDDFNLVSWRIKDEMLRLRKLRGYHRGHGTHTLVILRNTIYG